MSGRQRAPTGRSNAARDVSTGALTAREPSPRAGTAGNGAGAGTSAFSGRGMRPSFATAALASLTRPATSAAKIDSGSDISPREPQYSARFSGRDTETNRGSGDILLFDQSSQAKARPQETNPIEFLVTKNKQYIERMNAIERASNEKLGDYNEFSRPKASKNYPLRSVLFDPDANNFPKSKTRTELLEKIKRSGMPHLSYDIDGDGWVSRDDFLVSKRFDLDGNGVIDPEERLLAKHIVAEEFFSAHMHHIHLFGPGYANKSLQENVEALANSKIFERSYSRLKQIEVKLRQAGSQEMVDGMALADQRLTKYNFYSNKFDTSAWTDVNAIPRAASFTLPSNGSRKHLMFMRREADRASADEEFQRRLVDAPTTNFRRVNLITDTKNEND